MGRTKKTSSKGQCFSIVIVSLQVEPPIVIEHPQTKKALGQLLIVVRLILGYVQRPQEIVLGFN